jgi:hypothetical protein
MVRKHKDKINNIIAMALDLGIPPPPGAGSNEEVTAQSLGESSPLDQTDNEQKNYCTHCGSHQAPHKSKAGDSHRVEKKSPYICPHNSYHQIPDKSKSASAHDLATEPAGNQPNDQKTD